MNKARIFAISAHDNQRYGEHPYVVHLDAVTNLLQPFGETEVTVGFLHDVVEDTHVTLEQVQLEFGQFVADCVELLTDELGANRRERKVKTYEKMSKVTGELELALTVKVADRLANVIACIEDKKFDLLKMYQSEHETFHRAAFRVGRCDALWHELNSLFEDPWGKPES